MNKLSILTLTLNEEETILESLESSLTLDPMEFVIVDSGSTDNTLSIIENFSNKYPELPIKLVQKPLNGDFGKQRNEGIEYCSGDWILSLDADEIMNEDAKWFIKHMLYQKNVFAYSFPRIHLFPDRYRFLHKSYPDLQIRLFRNVPEIRFKGKIHEILFWKNDVPLFRTNGCKFVRDLTIIHLKLITSEKQLIEKGTRWEEFAEQSKEVGFDIGTDNPRRFIFSDHIGTKDEVPTDFIYKYHNIMYP